MKFLKDRRAAVLPIFAIALIPMIVATGAVIDYARAFQQRAVIQDAMDAAALAAGKKIGKVSDTLVKTEADNFYNSNIGTNKVETIPPLSKDISGATLTLNTTLTVKTYFLGLIGLNQFVFNVKSQSTQAAGTLEVAMALDNSGSMLGTKISTLITAASDLTDTLFALGATSTKLDPIKVAVIPFAGSVNVGASNRTSGWMDTTGVNPYHGENFEAASGSPPVSTNSPAVNVFNLYDSLNGAANQWGGCVEDRKAPYDVQDDAASTGTPATMFVPMFAPDEPDNWSCTTTNGCSKTCNSDASGATCTSGSAGLRYNGAPAGTFGYNNYLPDVNSLTCSPAVTISIATPGVVTRTAHGFAAGTSLVFQTTGSLPTGVTAGTTYYVSAAGLTTNAFDLTTTTTGTTFTSSGTPVTTTIAAPAVFTSTVVHNLAVNDQVTFATTGALPTGLTAGTSYYVKQVPTTTTFTVSATSANAAISSITKASPGVITTSAVHGLAVNNPVVFQTTGALPSPLVAGTTYYVKTVTSTTKFTVSATSGGTVINTTTAGSGTHTFTKLVTTTGSQSGSHNFVKVGAPTVFTSASHGFSVGNAIAVSSTGTLPAPLSASTVYYVVTVPNTNLYTISTTSGGTGITLTGSSTGTLSFIKLVATSGSQSGTHSIVSSTEKNDWTCANGTAGCGGTGIGESEQTALLGQNVASNNVCKYGTPTNKVTPVAVIDDISGYNDDYAGGPNLLCTTQAVEPLTTTQATVKSKISAMVASGTTNITAGLMWGWRALSPTAPFTDGRDYTVTDNKKILILMTDGQNTYESNGKFVVSQYGAWGYVWKSHLGTTSTNENTVQDKMDDRMELACANIKAAEITIYTVAFEITDATTKQLLVTCATDSTKAFSADSTAELTAAFTAIGTDISQLRLSQ